MGSQGETAALRLSSGRFGIDRNGLNEIWLGSQFVEPSKRQFSDRIPNGDSLIQIDSRGSYGHCKGEVIAYLECAKETCVSDKKSDVLQGTLDLMVLKTLHAMGPLHGFGIARRIEQLSEDVLQLNEGTVYTSLLRLQQQGWIDSKWGTSENNRKARFYSITRQGKKQLEIETENLERISGVIGRVLRLEGQG